jgi:hypothetical protein
LVGGWRLGDKLTSEAILGLLLEDSDRAAAIVACTILEDSLEKKLKSTLRNSTSFEKLFGTGQPLHFFGSRNRLAYLMRIYGKPFFTEYGRSLLMPKMRVNEQHNERASAAANEGRGRNRPGRAQRIKAQTDNRFLACYQNICFS